MKKFLKKTYFVAVSTFLALVLSIVSFGTYRNEAKADGIDYPPDMSGDFSVEAFVDALFPSLFEWWTNGTLCIFLDNNFMFNGFVEAGDMITDSNISSSAFMSYFLGELCVKYNIPIGNYVRLKNVLQQRRVHLVTYVSGDQYTNLVTGQTYNNIDEYNSQSFYTASGFNVSTTTFEAILNTYFDCSHMYELLVRIQADKGGTADDMPVYLFSEEDGEGFIVHNSLINDNRLEVFMYNGFGFMDVDL